VIQIENHTQKANKKPLWFRDCKSMQNFNYTMSRRLKLKPYLQKRQKIT